MDLGLIKILLKLLNYPLNLSPLYSQPAVSIKIFFFDRCHTNIFVLSLPLLSHATAAIPNCEFFNFFDFIHLFTIKIFSIVSIVLLSLIFSQLAVLNYMYYACASVLNSYY